MFLHDSLRSSGWLIAFSLLGASILSSCGRIARPDFSTGSGGTPGDGDGDMGGKPADGDGGGDGDTGGMPGDGDGDELGCGDGAIGEGESCDEGDRTTSGGCVDCEVLEGWECDGEPSECVAVAAPEIQSFLASTLSVPGGGGKVQLVWSVADADSLRIESDQPDTPGNVTGNTVEVDVRADTTFTLVAENDGGRSELALTVEVNSFGEPDILVQFGVQFGSTAHDTAMDLAVQSDGVLYVVGYTSGDTDGKTSGDIDAFLTKFSSSAERYWTRQLGTDTTDRAPTRRCVRASRGGTSWQNARRTTKNFGRANSDRRTTAGSPQRSSLRPTGRSSSLVPRRRNCPPTRQEGVTPTSISSSRLGGWPRHGRRRRELDCDQDRGVLPPCALLGVQERFEAYELAAPRISLSDPRSVQNLFQLKR